MNVYKTFILDISVVGINKIYLKNAYEILIIFLHNLIQYLHLQNYMVIGVNVKLF